MLEVEGKRKLPSDSKQRQIQFVRQKEFTANTSKTFIIDGIGND